MLLLGQMKSMGNISSQTFFFSHCSKDNPIVLEIAENIGKSDCWLYEWEVKVTDKVFKFDSGLSDSKIFVLFWSKWASESPWVKEEVEIARYRWITQKGYRPVIILLDNTPLPDFLNHRIHIKIENGMNYVVEQLLATKNDLTSPEVFYGKSDLKDFFQNREILFKTMEKISSSDAYSGIIITGIDGIGKTSFVKRAIAMLYPDLNPIWIDLKFASTPILLLSSFAKPFGISVDIEELSRNPELFWHDIIYPEISQSKKMFVVLDNLTYAGADYRLNNQIMKPLIHLICRDLTESKKIASPNLILISQYSPDLPSVTSTKFKLISVGTLEKPEIKRALKFHLKYVTDLDIDDQKIEKLAGKLKGYPLAIPLAANRVSEKGIDVILEDKSLLHNLLIDIAQDLFSGLRITNAEREILILLSLVSIPLNSDHLKAIFEDKWSAIGELKKKELLDPTSQDYRIHPVLSEYILSKMVAEKDISEIHAKIADLFEDLWKKSPKYSAVAAQYGSLTYTHSILGGKFDQAKEIQAVYLSEAKNAGIELYKNRNYTDAIKYLESAKEMDYENPDPIYDYYYALCLDRLSDTNRSIEIMKNLILKDPFVSKYYDSLARFQRKMKLVDDAIVSFRQAIAYSQGKGKIVPTIGLALLLFEYSSSYNNYLAESRNLILSIYDNDKYNPDIVDATAKILIKNDEVDFAIHVLSEALHVTPNDPKLHHRIGMILKDTGNFIAARDYLETVVKSPRPNVSVYSALADVYLNLNDDTKAEHILEQYPGSKWNDPAYLCTKANILRYRNKLSEAEPLIERAISIAGNDPLIFSCAIQIKIEKIRNACSIGMRQEALISLEEAKNYLKMGLELDPDFDGLLQSKHNLEEIQLHYGLK